MASCYYFILFRPWNIFLAVRSHRPGGPQEGPPDSTPDCLATAPG
ncbi:hypothetical protein [Spirulina major]|nr:hypothetical protein [Spirulina major]